MYYELFNDELMKRYMFLYENKELILAMCIRRINIDDELKKNIETWEDYKKRLRVADKTIFQNMIDLYSSQLGKEVPFLCSNVSSKIVLAFEEVLFTDGDLEETQLYRHIAALKNDPVLYESVMDFVDEINEKRSHNQFLKNYPGFSVWKILNYVRKKYKNNAVALEALDKYYNIERTMLTGLDSSNGYFIYGDECEDDNMLSKYPSLFLIGGVSGSYIISDYKNNKYELEDDYLKFGDEEDKVLDGEATTVFMHALSKMPMLCYEEKMNARSVYFGDVKKVLE